MLHRLVLKSTKFQLPRPKRLSTVVKNILGGHHAPMSNKVNGFIDIKTVLPKGFLQQFERCFPSSRANASNTEQNAHSRLITTTVSSEYDRITSFSSVMLVLEGFR